ncbi:putative F-box/kelch-repeat protein [Raphanus sativus]|nr:putative F-box/kelch-repeat protein [Raphanus sativus]
MTLIPGLVDEVAEMCLSRVPRSSFQAISQVCWRWRRYLRSERYVAVRKLTGSLEELMCVIVDDEYLEVFDGSGNNLGRIPPAPGPSKGGYGLVVLDGRIVFVGGELARAAFADVYEFNPATNRWRKLADMNIPRYCFTYAVVDGLLYVNKGYTSGDDSILNSEVYDPKTNEWSLMDCPHSHGFSAFAFSFNSKLFVVGGNRRAAHIL